MKRSLLKRKKKLPKKSKDSVSKAKDRIQKLLRAIVIKRDGGCLVAGYHHITGMRCSEILQAEHIVGRSHSCTYADLENIICLCVSHHGIWKKNNPTYYADLIQSIIGRERYARIHDKGRQTCHMVLSDWLKEEERLGKLS